MQFSEAIRLGALATKPTSFALISSFVDGSITTCALGAGYYAMGLISSIQSVVGELPPKLSAFLEIEEKCPFCEGSKSTAKAPIVTLIVHLNDYHELSRELTADIVQSWENRHNMTDSIEEAVPSKVSEFAVLGL